MNIVYISTVLVCISIISAAAKDDDGRNVGGLVYTESNRLAGLVYSPQKLLEHFLYESIVYWSPSISYYIKEALTFAILSDQSESLRILLVRINFLPDEHHDVIQKLLITAISNHKLEACHILMSQVDRFERASGAPSKFPYWQGMCGALEANELIELVESHPGFAMNLAGNARDMQETRMGDTMVQFNCHFAARDPAFAALEDSQPPALLKGLLRNGFLTDAGMAKVALRLCETGTAEVSYELAADFAKRRPDYVQTLQILREWIQEDAKVTEEDAELFGY